MTSPTLDDLSFTVKPVCIYFSYIYNIYLLIVKSLKNISIEFVETHFVSHTMHLSPIKENISESESLYLFINKILLHYFSIFKIYSFYTVKLVFLFEL